MARAMDSTSGHTFDYRLLGAYSLGSSHLGVAGGKLWMSLER
jgi:hypothetical protein